jgi:hypothetical protein
MFDDDEDGGKWIPSDNEYYGEVVFNITKVKKKNLSTGCILTTILL